MLLNKIQMLFNKSKLLFCFIIITFAFTYNVNSQDIKAELTNDTNNVLIGEQIELKIDVKFDKINNIVFPVFADTIGKIEIIDLFPIDTIKKDNKIEELSKRFIVTSFDSGSYEIPPFIISYNIDDDDNLRITETNPLILNFATVEIDTSQSSLKDIKPPIEMPFGFDDLYPYLLIALLIGLLYYAVIYILGRKRKKEEKIVPKYDPTIPADLEAIAQLQRLEREKLWQKGNFKTYYSIMTDILRIYIHRRYHLNALEMTTYDLIEELQRNEQNSNALSAITSILNIAELAKFAKHEPSEDDNISSMRDAYSFVNLTKVLDISEEDLTNSNMGGVEK